MPTITQKVIITVEVIYIHYYLLICWPRNKAACRENALCLPTSAYRSGADLGAFLGFPETPWRLDLLQKNTPAVRQQM